jgi:hypothetical protein
MFDLKPPYTISLFYPRSNTMKSAALAILIFSVLGTQTGLVLSADSQAPTPVAQCLTTAIRNYAVGTFGAATVNDAIKPALRYPAMDLPVDISDIYDDPLFWRQLSEGPTMGVKRYWFHYGAKPNGADSFYSSDMKAHFGWRGGSPLYISVLSRPIVGRGNDIGEWQIDPSTLSRYIQVFSKTEKPISEPIEVPHVREVQFILARINYLLNAEKNRDVLILNDPSFFRRFDVRKILSLNTLSGKVQDVIKSWQTVNPQEKKLKKELLRHSESYQKLTEFLESKEHTIFPADQ